MEVVLVEGVCEVEHTIQQRNKEHRSTRFEYTHIWPSPPYGIVYRSSSAVATGPPLIRSHDACLSLNQIASRANMQLNGRASNLFTHIQAMPNPLHGPTPSTIRN